MYTRTQIFPLLLACLMVVSLTACDQGSQKIKFDSGSNLTVSGPASITVPNYNKEGTAKYMVRAFTIKKDYTWTVKGATKKGTKRDGEVVVVSTTDPGKYTVTVSTTIDGKKYTGSAAGVANYPTAAQQASKFGLATFASLASSTGLLGQVGGGLTAFAPSDSALTAALDADGSGSVEEGEMPATGVLTSVLTYHVAADSLTSTEISDGKTVSTALNGTLGGNKWSVPLNFSVNGGVTANGQFTSAGVTRADIATKSGLVVHKVDGVLLPNSAVSINDQTVTRDTVANVDSVTVAGALVSNGGFVAIHKDSVSGDIIGTSDYLEASTSSDPHKGFHNDIGIELDSQLSDTTTVVAMTHRDNGDQLFTFNPTAGTDVPYFRTKNKSIPVVQSATVNATKP